jgi:hypothetical protein
MLIGHNELALASVSMVIFGKLFDDNSLKPIREAKELFDGLTKEHVAATVMKFRMTMELLDSFSELSDSAKMEAIQTLTDLASGTLTDLASGKHGLNVVKIQNESGEDENWEVL